MSDKQPVEAIKYCKTKLNFKLDPTTIDTTIPKKALELIQSGDENPYYVIEEIEDITKEANRVEFTKEFWESYLAVLKKRPIPGSKAGHNMDYGRTPENDLYVIGGKIEGKKVYLKNYIPKEGFTTPNARFIADMKAGLFHFSIVSYTRDVVTYDEDGWIESIKAVESVKGERNDAVEVGQGAMDQKVNRNKKQREDNKPMDNKEMIKVLMTQMSNGELDKKVLAKSLGIEIITEKHNQALKFESEVKALLGEKPIEQIKAMKLNAEKVEKQGYDNDREKAMFAAFGAHEIKVNGENKTNLKREAAEAYVSVKIVTPEELKSQVEAAKTNEVVLNFSKADADINSDVNVVSKTSGTSKKYRSEKIEA